jgi:murein DD-endopeptidase MepM/ murein hydrolase activator NlpD
MMSDVARSRGRPLLLVLVVLVALAVGGISYLGWRQSAPAVRAEFRPAPKFLGARTPVAVELKAARGTVESVEVRVVQGPAHAVVAQQSFAGAPAAEPRVQVVVVGRDLGLSEGAATIEVRARDNYWRPIRMGEPVVASAPVTIKFTPPTLEVLGATHYLHQGGGGLAILRAKGASRVGVKVADQFFPGYPAGEGDGAAAVALFALPWDLPDLAPISAWAEDEAGNSVSRPLPSELKPRRFPSGAVEISDKFLAAKLPELLPERAPVPPEQQVEAFLVVNRDKRKAAEQTKRDVAARTQPRPLWAGAFIQPRNTRVFSNFAESRSYRYRGKSIDSQVHFGYDLASLKNSPVPAANAGAVVFAGPLTIYGNAVIVDHGMGLMTLYGHLSTIEVKEGAAVRQGQALGRTGTTGLAVGDHLHYEVLIQGVSVTPVEWWDGKWIRDHIGRPLKEANVPLLQSEYPADSAVERPDRPVSKKRKTARSH